MPLYKYTDTYRDACFYAWYKAGRPSLNTGTPVLKLMPTDEDGNKPDAPTIRRWREDDGWEMRADALDAEVTIQLDNDAIQNRIAKLRELAENGNMLKNKGLKYLEESDSPFKDNPSAAVRAIVAGTEMEFKYSGQADILSTIPQMSNKQLDAAMRKLLGKNDNEIIDAEAEETTSEDSEPEDDADTDNE